MSEIPEEAIDQITYRLAEGLGMTNGHGMEKGWILRADKREIINWLGSNILMRLKDVKRNLAESDAGKIRFALNRLCRELEDVIDQNADGRYVIECDCEGVAVALEGAKVALGKAEE
jgi:hypothetical protein